MESSATTKKDFATLLSDWKLEKDWATLCPALSIDISNKTNKLSSSVPNNDDGLDGDSKFSSNREKHESEHQRQKLVQDGYVLIDEPLDSTIIQKVKSGIESLHNLGLPPTLILLFNETWELARSSQSIMTQSTHILNSFNFDLLAWYIEAGNSGFSPHRDRQPENAAATFHDDGQAKFVTHWIALSDATPQNSCLYMIPKWADPGYVSGDTEEQDPLSKALPTKESYQHIRAFPRASGQSLLFTHRIIHWGSKGDSDSKNPRIAISFVCSDPSYEAPLVDPNCFTSTTSPPFSIRLLLVCAQLLIYYQRFELSKECIRACYTYCKEHENDLEKNYRKKVFLEFVKAMKETTTVTAPLAESLEPSPVAEMKPAAKSNNDKVVLKIKTNNFKDNGGDNDDDDDDDDEEAMMEEMLDAEAGGYGEFEDDYDDLEGNSGMNSSKIEQNVSDNDEDDEEEAGSEWMFANNQVGLDTTLFSTKKRQTNGDNRGGTENGHTNKKLKSA